MEQCAIAPQLRGQSWGSRALREFLAEGDPVVLEIDPPEDPVSRRRKGFYEGLGLVSNPWPHIHPPYRLEFSGHALEVMTFPGGWDEGQYRRFARYLDATVMADRPQKAAGAVELFQLLLEKGVQHASEQVGPAGSPEIWGLRGKGSFDIVLIEPR